MTDRTRRSFALSVCIAGTAGLAGCLSALRDDADPSGTDDADDQDVADEDHEDETDAEAEPDDEPSFDGGVVAFVYDDGPVEDYEQAFPVHQEFEVPASAGIVTEWVGREDLYDNDWMDLEQIETLADAGWEIMSHTTAHTALGTFDVVEDVDPGDDRIYPEERHHGFQRGYEIEITDGVETVRRTVEDSGSDDTGVYLDLDEPVSESFTAGETVERFPEELMHQFLGDSKARLESWGFEVDTLLAPYDVCDEWTIEFAREYYDGIANVNSSSMINDPETFDPFDTYRDYFIEFTTPEATEQELFRIANDDSIGILGAHTFKEEVTEAKIRQTLEWVEQHGLETMTFRELIEATS